MQVIDAYMMFTSLQLHFNSKTYDYFKYNGKVRVPKEFSKRKDLALFKRLSENYDPESLLYGNFLFSDKVGHVSQLSKDYQALYEKYRDNGTYHFKEDLKKLDDDFNSNFTVDSSNNIPYILKLYRSNDVSLHTCCVFNEMLNLCEKWKSKDQYMIFEPLAVKISKSTPFFDIDKPKYKALILNRFSVLN